MDDAQHRHSMQVQLSYDGTGHGLSNGNAVEEHDDHEEGDLEEENKGELVLENGGGGGGDDSVDQLTLYFQGQVYVFDSVTPEKVKLLIRSFGARLGPLAF